MSLTRDVLCATLMGPTGEPSTPDELASKNIRAGLALFPSHETGQH